MIAISRNRLLRGFLRLVAGAYQIAHLDGHFLQPCFLLNPVLPLLFLRHPCRENLIRLPLFGIDALTNFFLHPPQPFGFPRFLLSLRQGQFRIRQRSGFHRRIMLGLFDRE